MNKQKFLHGPHHQPVPKQEHKDTSIFYTTNTTYEITINPKDQHLHELHRFKAAYKTMKTFLKKYFNRETQYLFHPEISEPRYSNPTGSIPRIHYHGVITFITTESLADFLLETFHKLANISSFQINAHRPDHWQKYITKQDILMKHICKSYSLKPVITNYKIKK